jgi:hypothetical protein
MQKSVRSTWEACITPYEFLQSSENTFHFAADIGECRKIGSRHEQAGRREMTARSKSSSAQIRARL